MLVRLESLLCTAPNIEGIPLMNPWMMLRPAVINQDPAPEKLPMILLGRELTKLITPLTPADTAARMAFHAEDVMLTAALQPELMALLTALATEDTTLLTEFQADDVRLTIEFQPELMALRMALAAEMMYPLTVFHTDEVILPT